MGAPPPPAPASPPPLPPPPPHRSREWHDSFFLSFFRSFVRSFVRSFSLPLMSRTYGSSSVFVLCVVLVVLFTIEIDYKM